MITNTSRMAAVAAALRSTSFYKMPASVENHNNFEGGLLEHSTNVWFHLENLTHKLGLDWQDPSSPFIIAMLHDACKIDAYFYNHGYRCWERKEDHPEEHGELSLRVAESLGIPLTSEEKACIRWHMGSIEGPGFFEAVKQYPNVFWVHAADVTARSDEIVGADSTKTCCICGNPLGQYGNNPWPLADEGECCDTCNFTKVVPARIGGINNEK